MRMMIRVLARKLGRTNARLSRVLSRRRASMASKTTEKMDQTKEIMGTTVPNPLGRQLSFWSHNTPSASATLGNISSKDSTNYFASPICKARPQLTMEQRGRL